MVATMFSNNLEKADRRKLGPDNFPICLDIHTTGATCYLCDDFKINFGALASGSIFIVFQLLSFQGGI